MFATGFGALAEDQTISNACRQLAMTRNASYVLTVSAEHKIAKVRIMFGAPGFGFTDFTVDGEYRAGDNVRRVLLPEVLHAGFAPNTNGEVQLEVSIGGSKTNVWQFSSIGTAESLYALRLLSPEQKWAKELAMRIPPSQNIAAITSKNRGELLKGASTIPPSSEIGTASLRVVKEFFNANRAEILAKFGRGYLFYPPADDLDWALRERGGAIYAESGCHDLMFAAAFVVQVEPSQGGRWQPKLIYVDSWFKGE